MNIFVLDKDPRIAAQYHHDVHVRKMIVETCQLLANTLTPEELALAPKTQTGNIRKHSHHNHPCSVWARHSAFNRAWLWLLGANLCMEYAYRFNKQHFCADFINWYGANTACTLMVSEWSYANGSIVAVTGKLFELPLSLNLYISDQRAFEKLMEYLESTDGFKQCFGNQYSYLRSDDPVASYRQYYSLSKRSFIRNGKEVKNTWTKRPVPFFMREPVELQEVNL